MIFTLLLLSLLLSLLSLYFFFIKENLDNIENIIGYIHICQKGEWKRSFNLLMDSVKSSGLYDKTTEIRLGIVNEEGTLIDDPILNDNKFKIIFVGNSKEYERPTLLHMKNSKDSENTMYYYLHTKGIKHFNTDREEVVLNWINNMLNCNIINWRDVIKKLRDYETYGCNYNHIHYSGNFWWATKNHIDKLPNHIEDYYVASEDWVLINKDNMFCNDNCGDNYVPLFPNGFY